MTTTTITIVFPFGSTVRDIITGFEGVVSGYSTAITGCDQYCVNPPVKDGAYVDGRWIDEQRLELVESAGIVKLPVPTKIQHLGAGPEGPPKGGRRS